MPGKFVIKKGSTGKYRFNLLSTNGQVVATSEAYNSKAACMNGIKTVQRLSVQAQLEDQTTREWAEQAKKAAAKKTTAKKSAAKKASATKS